MHLLEKSRLCPGGFYGGPFFDMLIFHGPNISRTAFGEKSAAPGATGEPPMNDFRMRFVRTNGPDARDAADILAIYAPFVRGSAVTFEYDVPSVEEFTRRVEGLAAVYPYLVCETDGKIVAYAYASRYMERAAYAWGVQVSVYAAPEARGRGVARSLYAGLFAMLEKLGYCNAYALITLPNDHSVRFHQSFGFVPAGLHHKCGYKLGAWHDVAWMEKNFGTYADTPEQPRPVGSLTEDFCAEIFSNTKRY